jgi:hypothetical protein
MLFPLLVNFFNLGAGGTTVTSKSIVGKKRVTVIKNKRSVTVNTFKQCNNGKDIYGR